MNTLAIVALSVVGTLIVEVILFFAFVVVALAMEECRCHNRNDINDPGRIL